MCLGRVEVAYRALIFSRVLGSNDRRNRTRCVSRMSLRLFHYSWPCTPPTVGTVAPSAPTIQKTLHASNTTNGMAAQPVPQLKFRCFYFDSKWWWFWRGGHWYHEAEAHGVWLLVRSFVFQLIKCFLLSYRT